jgi:hypothetical protein
MESVEHELAKDLTEHFKLVLDDPDSNILVTLKGMIIESPLLAQFELPDFLATHYDESVRDNS